MLEIPSIVMKPSLDDIQQALNRTVQIMLKTTQVGWRHCKFKYRLVLHKRHTCCMHNILGCRTMKFTRFFVL